VDAIPYSKPSTTWTCDSNEGYDCPAGTDANICCWRDVEGVTPSTSPYYTDSNCDPLCINALPNEDGVCTRPICVIDDVTVTAINTPGSTLTLSQVCGGDGDYGYCYIGDVTVEGNVAVELNNQCGQCYTFTDDISDATQIDCDGSAYNPDQPDQPDQPYQPEGKPWYKHWIVIAALIIIGVLVLLGFGIGYYYKHKKVAQPEVEVYDPTDAYYNFDFSDFDFTGY
jgi:hypothetical protein